jgi:hypothetical protein
LICPVFINQTPIAIRAAIAATTKPTGPVIIVKVGAERRSYANDCPDPLAIAPSTNKYGPIAAASPAIVMIMDCVLGSSSANQLTAF